MLKYYAPLLVWQLHFFIGQVASIVLAHPFPRAQPSQTSVRRDEELISFIEKRRR